MLVGIMGQMGAGKSYTMSILCSYLSRATGAGLYANYGLVGASPIEYLDDVVDKENAIFAFDEIWLSADARQWKDNVRLTQWINQTRKKRMIVMYTTQHIRQVEMRIRNGTDILIYCEKKGTDHRLSFIDWQYQRIMRTFVLPRNPAFYSLYDTYEVLKPLAWRKRSQNTDSAYKAMSSDKGK